MYELDRILVVNYSKQLKVNYVEELVWIWKLSSKHQDVEGVQLRDQEDSKLPHFFVAPGTEQALLLRSSFLSYLAGSEPKLVGKGLYWSVDLRDSS